MERRLPASGDPQEAVSFAAVILPGGGKTDSNGREYKEEKVKKEETERR